MSANPTPSASNDAPFQPPASTPPQPASLATQTQQTVATPPPASATTPRIKSISISGYRAFPQYRPKNFEINLGDTGKNLLLYGENGSGKTSLFKALRDLFNRTLKDTDYSPYQNIFDIGTDDSVAVELTSDPPRSFSWGVGASHPSTDTAKKTSFNNLASYCFFLDYRSLLETNFVHKSGSPNIYDILTGTILYDTKPLNLPPIGGLRLRMLEALKKTQNWGNSSNQRAAVTAASDMTTALAEVLPSVVDEANRILATLVQDVSIKLEPLPTITYLHNNLSWNRHFAGTTIPLKIWLNGREILEPQHFLNEARLSAIALSIYLGSARITRAGRPGILVLDDVLIGLDLSNRIPLLKLFQSDFVDWQIFLFTHDHTWYDLAKSHLDKKDWESKEMYLVSNGTNAFDRPEMRNGDLLVKAQAHLNAGDLMAAAVYIRAAFETKLKKVCDESGIEVIFKRNPKEIKADYFWSAIKRRQELRKTLQGNQASKNHPDFIPYLMVSAIDLVSSTVLNQLSHSAPPTFAKTEVQNALDIIKQFQQHSFPPPTP